MRPPQQHGNTKTWLTCLTIISTVATADRCKESLSNVEYDASFHRCKLSFLSYFKCKGGESDSEMVSGVLFVIFQAEYRCHQINSCILVRRVRLKELIQLLFCDMAVRTIQPAQNGVLFLRRERGRVLDSVPGTAVELPESATTALLAAHSFIRSPFPLDPHVQCLHPPASRALHPCFTHQLFSTQA